MSTIKVDTIQKANGTSQIGIDKIGGVTSASIVNVIAEGGTNTTNLAQGLAKAWINFNGEGTIASRDSFSISSLSDSGTGKYQINFSSALSNNDYACSGLARNPGQYTGILQVPADGESDQATGSLEFFSTGTDGNAADRNHVYVIVLGDLA